MSPRTSWLMFVAALALLSASAGCAQQSSGLGGAALPQQAAAGAETSADGASTSDGSAANDASAVQPEAGIPIPTRAPIIHWTMADINIDQAVRDVTQGKGIQALGIDQLGAIEQAITAQAARKMGGIPGPWFKIGCRWVVSHPGKPILTCTFEKAAD